MGTTTFEDGSTVHTERYLEHDSVFEETREVKNNKLFRMRKSASEKEFHDSTFSTTYYYDNGNVMEVGSLFEKRKEGIWSAFYSNGNKKSVSKFEKGNLQEMKAWWENGNLNIESNLTSEGKMIHNEFYENGNPAQQLEIDSVGSGKCKNFYSNGKTREEGSIYRKEPVGIWNRFDSLGNKMHDTLMGISSAR